MDHLDLRGATDACAPGGHIDVGLGPFPSDAAVTVDRLTIGPSALFSGGGHIALFFGDQAGEGPGEGRDAVWSSADLSLSGRLEPQGLGGTPAPVGHGLPRVRRTCPWPG